MIFHWRTLIGDIRRKRNVPQTYPLGIKYYSILYCLLYILYIIYYTIYYCTPNITPGYYPQQSLAHCTDPVRVPLQLELYCIVRQVCLNVYINLKLLSHKKREPIKLNLLVNGLGVVDIWSSMEPKTYQSAWNRKHIRAKHWIGSKVNMELKRYQGQAISIMFIYNYTGFVPVHGTYQSQTISGKHIFIPDSRHCNALIWIISQHGTWNIPPGYFWNT